MKQDKPSIFNKRSNHDVFCLHCGFLIDDYYADLKCPECKCNLEGEAKQLMVEFKAYLDKNGLVCIGDKIIDKSEEIKLELGIKEFIEYYNKKLEESAFIEELATMDVQAVSKDLLKPKNRFRK